MLSAFLKFSFHQKEKKKEKKKEKEKDRIGKNNSAMEMR